jgi:heptosyltransferase-2
MALPAIDIARELTGADHIVIMARAATAPLFVNHPEIDRVVTIDDKDSRLRGPQRAAGTIRNDEFDVGVILPPSFSSALIFKLAGVKGRIGYAGDKRSILLTRAIKYPEEKMHRAQQYLHLFEKLTGRKASFGNSQLYLSHENIAEGADVLAARSLSYDDRYIVISPQAVAASRRWGSEKYGRLAARLSKELDCRIVLMGTDSDTEAGEIVRQRFPDGIINLCGKTSLTGAAAIISFGRLFVGNDSGLAHLAGAVNCPLVVLSGPDDPRETSPLCKKKKLIIKDIDCISCVKNDCPKKGDDFMLCMKMITVDEVFNAAKSLFKA